MKLNIKTSEIRNAYKEHNFDVVKVSVLDFKNQYNVNSNNLYILLKDAAGTLDSKEILKLQDNGLYKETRIGAFKYNTKERCIDIMFNPDIIVDLLALKELYGKYRYNAVLKFKKTPSFRLYELLKDSVAQGGRKFKLEELKERLGFSPTSYPDYYEFKRSLLQKSIKEITEYTDLTNIEIEEHKDLKKVVALTLNVKCSEMLNEDICDILYTPTKEEIDRMSVVTGIDLTEAQAISLIEVAIITISRNKLDIGFYDYLEQLKNTGVIWSLI
jgi:plasmid replication initiation protein